MTTDPQSATRVVLITGATGDLARAVVPVFADEGGPLVLTARDAQELQAIADGLDVPTLTHTADLTDPESVGALVQAAEERFGHVDVLVHLAGAFASNNPVAELDFDAWHKMLRLNFEAAVYVARAVLPGMVARGYGKLVYVGARTAQQPAAGSLGYAAAKAGLEALVKTLAAENKRKGINANMVTLTSLKTETNRQANPKGKYEDWVDPADVATVLRFLASDEARAIHGAIVPVWGVT